MFFLDIAAVFFGRCYCCFPDAVIVFLGCSCFFPNIAVVFLGFCRFCFMLLYKNF